MDHKSISDDNFLRISAVKNFDILDSEPEEAFDRITELATLIFDAPAAVLSLIDSDRFWFKSKVGIPYSETARKGSLFEFTTQKKDFCEIQDITNDMRFQNNLISEFGPIVSYAGCPLVDPNGIVIGTLSVLDTKPMMLSEKQKKSLGLLSREVMLIMTKRAESRAMQGYKDLFNLSNDMICVAGTDGFFKRINPAFEKVLGWDEPYLLRTSFFDLVHPDDLEVTRAEVSKLAQGIKTINFAHRFRTKSQEYRVLQWVATLEPGEGHLYAIARDVTDDSIKEFELLLSEERARIFFENSQGFMCTHDLSGKFTSVNEAGAAILGYRKSEILTMDLFDIVPKQRHDLVSAYLEEISNAGHSKGQMVTTHKDGSYHIWQYNNILEKSLRGDNYVIGNAIDITQRYNLEIDLKKTKETLEQTNRVARVGGWELDVQKQRLLWTSVTKDIHGVPPDYEPTLEEAIFFYKEGSSRDSIAAAVGDALEKGLPWDLDLEIVTRQGNEIWVRAIGNVETVQGECKRLYGTFQDITQIVLQREELKTAMVKAENASMAKSEFLANMSHEIRTPLNGVIGFTDLVLKTNLNDIQHQYLAIVNQSANALLSIINDILDFSKIEAGKLELNVEKCDIYEMAGQAADIISYQAQNKGLEMLLDISSELPRFIYADAIRLKQILVNLLGNAAKFTKEGEISLKIIPIKQSADQSLIRFAVRDTGIGIQPEKQHKIFEAFSQEDASTTKRYGGTGLGLTISNKLLALMGSRLQLESDPGRGSTFYFDVTFAAEQGDAVEWQNAEGVKKALIVDDNENNRIILHQMLLLKNIHCTLAKDGLEALQLLAAGNKYDVVLMDYHMPLMDGLETIKKIRQSIYRSAAEQPIVLLHSSADDEIIIEACQEFNISHHLVKPIKLHDIYHALSRLGLKEAGVVQKPDVATIGTANSSVILIAEDNPVNMMLVRSILARIAPDAIMVEAANGSEAVEFCRTSRPDLIMMDIQMPEMNGYEATQAIRNLGHMRIPIVALTAGNVLGEKEKCQEAGMDDFVVKPVREANIIDVLTRWLPKNTSAADS